MNDTHYINFNEDMYKYKLDIIKMCQQSYTNYSFISLPSIELLVNDVNDYIFDNSNDISNYINIGLSSIMFFTLFATVSKLLFFNSNDIVEDFNDDVETETEIEEIEGKIEGERESKITKSSTRNKIKNKKRYNNNIYSHKNKIRKFHNIKSELTPLIPLTHKSSPLTHESNQEVNEDFTLIGDVNPNIDINFNTSLNNFNTSLNKINNINNNKNDINEWIETSSLLRNEMVKYYDNIKTEIPPQLQNLFGSALESCDNVLNKLKSVDINNVNTDLNDNLTKEVLKYLDSVNKTKKD